MNREVKIPASNLRCPGCGSAVDIRLPGRTLSVACKACGSLIDLTQGEFKVVAQYNAKQKFEPHFELGSRGNFEGSEFEFVGVMQRCSWFPGENGKPERGDRWVEYYLFNPYLGYRYLSFWAGHWSYGRLLNALPIDDIHPPSARLARDHIRWQGRKYKHFGTYWSTVEFCLGEFNYVVQKDDKAYVSEYVRNGELIALEQPEDNSEITMSHSRHIEGSAVQHAFALKKPLPAPSGVGPTSFNPHVTRGKIAWLFSALLAFLTFYSGAALDSSAAKQQLLKKMVIFPLQKLREAPVKYQNDSLWEYLGELGTIDVRNDIPTTLRIGLHTNLSNNSALFTLLLMNEETRTSYNFAEEIEYYYGSDWSEGSRSGEFVTKPIEPGRYTIIFSTQLLKRAEVSADVTIIQDDPPTGWYYLISLILLLLPLWYNFRSYLFEEERKGNL